MGSWAQQLRCAGILTSLLMWFLHQQPNLPNVLNSSLNLTGAERDLGQAGRHEMHDCSASNGP